MAKSVTYQDIADYTGLTKKARISERGGKPRKVRLDREYNVEVTVTIPANSYTWLVVK